MPALGFPDRLLPEVARKTRHQSLGTLGRDLGMRHGAEGL
jgi:hypothetical protein